ncbi:dnaK protein [Trichomonas vaginalis G3]|uniref:DnaK protein n=1 Tax=Trichomonas vaginalis (strain ATCC PRA-98 / G3) TaxID=412133 RepID=A2G5H6_TRIV3|nr:ATP binding [Trichomonas vaginalis G3]EAX87594.1 dnaK protein [Trichomonas vaginalis G3]KAI5499817.1 ATP binding [Trichomonas vaginalis G3]|eukprot:XP_001300524.1 dnaK protein [Trichomonas vaginalis G3]
MNEGPFVGIDLGTTFSTVAVYKPAQKSFDVLKIDGDTQVPSVIAFGDELVYGQRAKSLMANIPQNTVYDSKRMIGKMYSELDENDIRNWPFKVNDYGGAPSIQAVLKRQIREYRPYEISSYILSYLKKKSEDQLGVPIKKAVITVPAYFDDRQKAETKLAAKFAGFGDFELMNEPTAAALCYMHTFQKFSDSSKILVYDFGGGTFDVSLVGINGKNFEVIGYDGDSHLGGQDIDNALVQYFAPNFLMKTRIDIFADDNQSKRYKGQMKQQCEHLKKQFSPNVKSGSINIQLPTNDNHTATIDVDKYNQIISPIIDLSFTKVDYLLAEHGVNPSQLTDIILVGGTSLIPLIREKIRDKYKIEPKANIPPFDAVAAGACIKAYLKGRKKQRSSRAATTTRRSPQMPPPVNYPRASTVEDNPYANLEPIPPIQPQVVSIDPIMPPSFESISSGEPEYPDITIITDQPIINQTQFEPLFEPPPNIEYVPDENEQPNPYIGMPEEDIDIEIQEATPHSFGIIANKKVVKMIEKNTKYPYSRTKAYHRRSESQTITIKVAQGESEIPSECKIIGIYSVQMPEDIYDIDITLTVDSDGIMSVRANYSDETKKFVLNNEHTSLSHQDIDRLQANRAVISAENRFQTALDDWHRYMTELKKMRKTANEGKKRRINDNIERIETYIDDNPNPSADEIDRVSKELYEMVDNVKWAFNL